MLGVLRWEWLRSEARDLLSDLPIAPLVRTSHGRAGAGRLQEASASGSLVKVRVGLARGKKQHDKRQASRARDARRQIDQAMGRRR